MAMHVHERNMTRDHTAKRYIIIFKKNIYKKVYNFEQSRNVGQFVQIQLNCLPFDSNLTCNGNYK